MKMYHTLPHGLIVCLLLCCSAMRGQQEPSFLLPIYVEDAMGHRDTIVFGAAPDADDGYDAIYGEVIDTSAFDTVLDVRLMTGFPPIKPVPANDVDYFKKMIVSEDGTQHGTTSYIATDVLVIIHAAYPPVSIHYDSSLLGYPSLVNVLWSESEAPFLYMSLEDAYEVGSHPLHRPGFVCMMNHDSFVEDFAYYRYKDSIRGEERTPYQSAYIEQVDGQILNVPTFSLIVFPSYLDNFFCDAYFTSVSEAEGLRRDGFVVANPVQGGRLYLESQEDDADAIIRIYDTGGRLVSASTHDLLPRELNVDYLAAGSYFVEVVLPDRSVRSVEQIIVVE